MGLNSIQSCLKLMFKKNVACSTLKNLFWSLFFLLSHKPIKIVILLIPIFLRTNLYSKCFFSNELLSIFLPTSFRFEFEQVVFEMNFLSPLDHDFLRTLNSVLQLLQCSEFLQSLILAYSGEIRTIESSMVPYSSFWSHFTSKHYRM